MQGTKFQSCCRLPGQLHFSRTAHYGIIKAAPIRPLGVMPKCPVVITVTKRYSASSSTPSLSATCIRWLPINLLQCQGSADKNLLLWTGLLQSHFTLADKSECLWSSCKFEPQICKYISYSSLVLTKNQQKNKRRNNLSHLCQRFVSLVTLSTPLVYSYLTRLPSVFIWFWTFFCIINTAENNILWITITAWARHFILTLF